MAGGWHNAETVGFKSRTMPTRPEDLRLASRRSLTPRQRLVTDRAQSGRRKNEIHLYRLGRSPVLDWRAGQPGRGKGRCRAGHDGRAAPPRKDQ